MIYLDIPESDGLFHFPFPRYRMWTGSSITPRTATEPRSGCASPSSAGVGRATKHLRVSATTPSTSTRPSPLTSSVRCSSRGSARDQHSLLQAIPQHHHHQQRLFLTPRHSSGPQTPPFPPPPPRPPVSFNRSLLWHYFWSHGVNVLWLLFILILYSVYSILK